MEGVTPMVTDEMVPLTEACERAGVTYRQIDSWARCGVLRFESTTRDGRVLGNRGAGSGTRRQIEAWKIPRLRLLGKLQRELGGRNYGINGPLMRAVFENYREGQISFDGFSLSWWVEEE